MYKLILEKGNCNITILHVAKSIKNMSQVPFEYLIVKYHNIFKDSFVTHRPRPRPRTRTRTRPRTKPRNRSATRHI